MAVSEGGWGRGPVRLWRAPLGKKFPPAASCGGPIEGITVACVRPADAKNEQLLLEEADGVGEMAR